MKKTHIRVLVYRWIAFVMAMIAVLAVSVAANGYRSGWADGGNAGYAACMTQPR